MGKKDKEKKKGKGAAKTAEKTEKKLKTKTKKELAAKGKQRALFHFELAKIKQTRRGIRQDFLLIHKIFYLFLLSNIAYGHGFFLRFLTFLFGTFLNKNHEKSPCERVQMPVIENLVSLSQQSTLPQAPPPPPPSSLPAPYCILCYYILTFLFQFFLETCFLFFSPFTVLLINNIMRLYLTLTMTDF
jgi:hypothetical protein